MELGRGSVEKVLAGGVGLAAVCGLSLLCAEVNAGSLARARALRSDGGRSFSGAIILDESVTPYCDIFESEGALFVRGVFPDEAGRLLVVDAARARFPGKTLHDETEVSGAAKDAVWIALLPAWLDVVASLENVAVHTSRDSVRVSGYATTFEKKAAIADVLKRDVRSYVDAIEVETRTGRLQARVHAYVDAHPVEFLSEQAELTPEGAKAVLGVAELLKGESVHIDVEGHTDNSGRRVSNLELSEQRAAAIRLRLIASGVDPTHIQSKGFGADRPIAENDTEAGRRRNRRIDFRIR